VEVQICKGQELVLFGRTAEEIQAGNFLMMIRKDNVCTLALMCSASAEEIESMLLEATMKTFNILKMGVKASAVLVSGLELAAR
jgi:hypothetical protein